jgi:hypothetical protein
MLLSKEVLFPCYKQAMAGFIRITVLGRVIAAAGDGDHLYILD